MAWNLTKDVIEFLYFVVRRFGSKHFKIDSMLYWIDRWWDSRKAVQRTAVLNNTDSSQEAETQPMATTTKRMEEKEFGNNLKHGARNPRR